jgi:hypothetical protein
MSGNSKARRFARGENQFSESPANEAMLRESLGERYGIEMRSSRQDSKITPQLILRLLICPPAG